MWTVLLADDHQVVRSGLRLLLDELGDEFVVAAEAEDGVAAVQAAEKHQPDVALVDFTMPESNGADAARRMLERSPKTKIIALSMHADGRTVNEMLRAGARGYVLKSDSNQELTAALRAVVQGRTYLSPSVAKYVVDRALAPVEEARAIPLSVREREVLQRIAEGASTKEIAASLNVSVKTVETHRKHIMDKLGIHTIAGLTKYALREGLTVP